MDAEICSNNSDGETVFLDNAQLVQTPENFPLPSLIWLDSVDRIYGVLSHSLYFSRSFGFVFRGSFSDREIDFTFPSAITPTPESASQVIESGSQILNGIASDSGDFRSDWLNIREAIRGSSLRTNLTRGFVWPSFKESVNFNI